MSVNDGNAHVVQKWLWYQAMRGWDPVGGVIKGDPQYWTHEDNQMAMSLGWTLMKNTEGHIDLVSMGQLLPKTIMESIKALAPVDPLAAKALAILTKAKMANPDYQFSFEK